MPWYRRFVMVILPQNLSTGHAHVPGWSVILNVVLSSARESDVGTRSDFIVIVKCALLFS